MSKLRPLSLASVALVALLALTGCTLNVSSGPGGGTKPAKTSAVPAEPDEPVGDQSLKDACAEFTLLGGSLTNFGQTFGETAGAGDFDAAKESLQTLRDDLADAASRVTNADLRDSLEQTIRESDQLIGTLDKLTKAMAANDSAAATAAAADLQTQAQSFSEAIITLGTTCAGA